MAVDNREYFVFDLRHLRIKGYRLTEKLGKYAQLFPFDGRMRSEVLALDLSVDGNRLRFSNAGVSVPYEDELIARLDAALEQVRRHAQAEEQRAQAEAQRAQAAIHPVLIEPERAQAEAERAQAEAERARIAEQRLAVALAELEAIKRG